MLIDSHCHLIHEDYKETPEEIIEDSKRDGVDKFITIGTSVEESQKMIEVAERNPEVFCTVGIFPQENSDKSLEELEKSLEEQISESRRIVAVGECGIDVVEFSNMKRSIKDQVALFEMQIKLVIKHKLPIIIHNRNGDKYILELLEKYKNSGLFGVNHCFVSSWKTAKKILDLGFYISFSGVITYPSGKNILEVVEKVPMDRFLVETDAPYLAPEGYRGEINYPKYVRIVAKKVAEVKQKPYDEIERISYENTCRLFKLF
jgi:TatD DNase family protein